MNPALRTDARLLRLLSPEAMPAQPRADWRVRAARTLCTQPAALSLPCLSVRTPSLLPCVHLGASGSPSRSQSATG